MWKCKKCNEENEDSFDTCWKCQTFSEIGSKRYTEYVKETEKEDKKKLIIKKRELSIDEKFKKRKLEIWLITIVSFFSISFLLIFIVSSSSYRLTQYGNFIVVFISFFISTIIKKDYSKFLKEKIIKEIDKKQSK